jgi:hypothetical protein
MPTTAENIEKDAANDGRAPLYNDGYLRVYDAGKVTLLAEFRFGDPAFGASSAGVMTANAIAPTTALDDDDAAEWEAYADDGVTLIRSGTAGVTGSGNPLEFGTVTWTTGLTVAITSLTITQP